MDLRWRELERAAATGDVEAEGRLLRERVRAHDLAPEGLELAAFLGHPAAREVHRAGPQIERVESGRWITALSRFGPAAVCVAAVSAALFVLPIWEAGVPGDPRVRRALLQVQRAPLSTEDRVLARWSVESCRRGAGASFPAICAAHQAVEPDAPAVRARWAVRYAAIAYERDFAYGFGGLRMRPCAPRVPRRWTPRERSRTWRPSRPERRPAPWAEGVVRRAAVRALVPWALAGRDTG